MDNGYPRKIIVFCAKLSKEKVEFIQAYPRQSTEFFFDGLIKSFDFFGGIPKRIIFDNLKPAVKEVLQGSERVLQDEFLRFKSFYCFEAEFCGPEASSVAGSFAGYQVPSQTKVKRTTGTGQVGKNKILML